MMTAHYIVQYSLVEEKNENNHVEIYPYQGKRLRHKMSETPASMNDHHEPQLYEILLKGHLGPQWKDWFDGLTITLEEDGNTLLTGRVVDQAALHGLLKKVRDLGMPLVSVNFVNPGRAKTQDVKS